MSFTVCKLYMIWRLAGLGLDSLKSQKRLQRVLKCHEIEVSWTTNQSTGPAILQNTKPETKTSFLARHEKFVSIS